MNLTISDQLVVFFTATWLYIHIKQLLITPNFMLSAIIGIWAAMSVFDYYAIWRSKNQ